ncbi:hypothetical protein L1887_35735 [Cichorium endivia]|nr:hypothetical protein L1887_35735 [Cichorium endivia]
MKIIDILVTKISTTTTNISEIIVDDICFAVYRPTASKPPYPPVLCSTTDRSIKPSHRNLHTNHISHTHTYTVCVCVCV